MTATRGRYMKLYTLYKVAFDCYLFVIYLTVHRNEMNNYKNKINKN